jgi:putative ABC transport system substrate-binding protein
VAVLWNPNHLGNPGAFKETQVAAQALKGMLISREVRNQEEIERVFSAINKDRPRALLELADPLTFLHRGLITERANKHRLPAMYSFREAVDAGGLMSYGTSFPDLLRRAATYVDKILKGTKPADLPVEQPMTFELVINLKTAKQIGLTIPPNVLVRADKVIKQGSNHSARSSSSKRSRRSNRPESSTTMPEPFCDPNVLNDWNNWKRWSGVGSKGGTKLESRG